jgi:hypothetical protein
MKVDSLVPLAHVADVSRSVDFCVKLGFEVVNSFKPQDRLQWVWLRTGNADLMLGNADEPVIAVQQAVLFYVYTPDVPGMREKLIRDGVDAGPITFPFYNPRGEFRIEDPDGYVVMVAHTD